MKKHLFFYILCSHLRNVKGGNMEYTQKEYEEDLKMSRWVFNKCFKNSRQYEDDLIEAGLINLWKKRKYFDPSKGTYSTYAFKVAYVGMLMFLRKEKKYFHNFSLDCDNSESSSLLEILIAPEITTNDIDLEMAIEKVLEKKCAKYKTIITLLLNGYTQKEIVQNFDISKQLCSLRFSKFKRFLKEELEGALI